MKLFGLKERKPFRISYGGKHTEGRSLTFTRFGGWFVLITLAVGIAAVNSGSNLLYLVVSMMLSMMVLSGVMSEQVLRRLWVSRVVPEQIYAGDPFTVRYALSNLKRRVPSFALTVSGYYPGGGRGRGAFLMMLGPGEKGHAAVDEVVPARGRWAISGFEVSTRFPFGLFRKSILLPRAEQKTVYPRIRPMPPETLDAFSNRYGDIPAGRRGQGTDVHNLREYLPRDEARLIHWKSSARFARLMAKEFEAEHEDIVTVILDNMMPEAQSSDYTERFEEAVSLAASAISHAVDGLGRHVTLVTRDTVTGPGSGREAYLNLMEILAALEAVPPGDVGEARDVEDALDSGVSVLVLPGPDAGWAGYRGRASVTLEAGAI